MALIQATHAYNIIYVYCADDADHQGIVKIGKATVHVEPQKFEQLTPNCPALVNAANERIHEQTGTYGAAHQLLYTELAHIKNEEGEELQFYDTDVHQVLLNSGYTRHFFPKLDKQPQEWFDIAPNDIHIVEEAIAAVKEGRSTIDGPANTPKPIEIVFRDEQLEAIESTVSHFAIPGKMLWNAKMRFGKTLCALETVRRLGFQKTLILTHRPSVKSGWFDDFKLIKFQDYSYGSKPSANSKNGQPQVGEKFDVLQKSGKPFIYFASMQDLRGSWNKGTNSLKKNEDVFATHWDLVIIDEAHEGTKTALGQNVIHTLEKKCKHFLYLSGTPYNILDQFKNDEIYTWDYINEQDAKERWNDPDKPNPYEGLAHLNIRTYNLGSVFDNYNHSDEDYFEFSEFFRTWTGDEKQDGMPLPDEAQMGAFVHETDVCKFLQLLHKSSEDSYYPFSREEYKSYFAHTFWVLPGVKEAAALSQLLQTDDFFKDFYVVNVAGEGDKIEQLSDSDDAQKIEKQEKDCVKKVKDAIATHDRTITLSCGRLTTGVSIEQWTAVFMLAGSYNTKAAGYLQTIFRAQTPFKHTPGIKTDCYAFDFAPDRTLTVIDEYIKTQSRNSGGSKHKGVSLTTQNFLKYCSVIAIDGSKTVDYNAINFMQQVNHVYTEHVIQKGFRDSRLYTSIVTVGEADLDWINDLGRIVGEKVSGKKAKAEVVVSKEGVNGANGQDAKKHQSHKKQPSDEPTPPSPHPKRSPAEEARSMLRKVLDIISVRLPMMIFGTVDNVETLTLAKFIEDIDSNSWKEFMPSGFTKEHFHKLLAFYNNDVFIASALHIVDQAKEVDKLSVTERVSQMAALIGTFHYPDKETVLTPWRVVNMHMTDTLGGYDFYDETHQKSLSEPRFVQQGDITQQVFGNTDTRILEINSKSGVYPLWVAYTLYRMQADHGLFGAPTDEAQKHALWKQVVEKNLFVVCQTPMAEKITRRVLVGYQDDILPNTTVLPNLVEKLKKSKSYDTLVAKVQKPSTYNNFNMGSNKLKFSAVVGNPPYQITTAKKETQNGQKAVTSIFQYFQMLSDELGQFTSLIYPGRRWIHQSGKGMKDFGLAQINDKRLSKLEYFPNSTEVFDSVGIADGVSIVFKEKAKDSDRFEYVFREHGQAISVPHAYPGEAPMVLCPLDETIVENVSNVVKERFDNKFLNLSIFPQKLFSIESDFVENNPELVREYHDGDVFDKDKEIKLLTNDKAGKAGRAKWYIANRSVITTGLDVLNDWKVIVSSANAGGQKRSNQLEIVDNYSAFGRARVALKTFNTKKEAENFYAYAQSKLIRFMFLMTDEALTTLAQLVPDIFDYSDNNGIIDFSKDLNDQLYNLFNIDEPSRLHIEEVLSHKPQ